MELNKNNLEEAAKSIAANAQEIENFRAQINDADIYEAAQMFLLNKFDLSQTEASEIVDGLKNGIDSYKSTHAAMENNSETAIKSAIETAVSDMSYTERVRYLASMLSALELATNNEGLDQSAIDEKLDSNLAKSEDELTAEIIETIENVPVGVLCQAADQLDAESISKVTSAIEKNTDEYRFLAALQLYIAQREGTFKPLDENQKLTPMQIGALASGATEAMLATADYKAGKIDLETWQEIFKMILGTLFVVAVVGLAIFGMILLSLPLMDIFWSIFGTSVLSSILLCFLLIPVTSYVAEKTTDATFLILARLSPIYDKLILKATALFKSVSEEIRNLIKAHFGKAEIKASEKVATELKQKTEKEREQIECQTESGFENDMPVMA